MQKFKLMFMKKLNIRRHIGYAIKWKKTIIETEKKIPKICMEPQKTYGSQSNFKKE